MNHTADSGANLRNYAVVTLAYWGFTITDGALRMLVLLYFNQIGYTPLQIAFLFLFYEIFGIVTNFLGGWVGSQLGLKITLYSGIGLQVFFFVNVVLVKCRLGTVVSSSLCDGSSGIFLALLRI